MVRANCFSRARPFGNRAILPSNECCDRLLVVRNSYRAYCVPAKQTKPVTMWIGIGARIAPGLPPTPPGMRGRTRRFNEADQARHRPTSYLQLPELGSSQYGRTWGCERIRNPIHCASVRFPPRRFLCDHMWKLPATIGSTRMKFCLGRGNG